MTAIHFEDTHQDAEDTGDTGAATWATLVAMGLAAAAIAGWNIMAAPAIVAPAIVVSAQDCATCHSGATVLASVTLGHADVGLDVTLATGTAPAVHSTQDCASCHMSH